MDGLNAGKNHEEIMNSITIPEHLKKFHYIDPLYDRPEYIARNVICMYGGWWDGFSSHLMPATMVQQSEVVSELAGGASALIEKAYAVAEANIALACHLAEWAALAEPGNAKAQQCVIDIFNQCTEAEVSLMGRGIYSHAVRQAQKALDSLKWTET